MTNDEIKELLRDLAAKADAAGEVKSRTVRINFSGPREPVKEETPWEDPMDADSDSETGQETAAKQEEISGQETASKEEEISGQEMDSEGEAASPRRKQKAAKRPSFAARIREWQQERRTRRDVEEGLSDIPLDQLPEDLANKLRKEQLDAGAEQDLTPEHSAADDSVGDVKVPEDTAAEDSGGKAQTEDRQVPEDTGAEREAQDPPEKDGIAAPEAEGTVFRDAEKLPPSEETTVSHRRGRRGAGRSIRPAKRKDTQAVKPAREAADFDSDAAEFMDTQALQEQEEAALQQTKGNIKERKDSLLKTLGARGIGRRELIMIACGVALLLLIALIVLSIFENRKKSAHVTADEGLKITVEREPANWCQKGSVTLKVRADSPIQTITVNDVPTEVSGGASSTQITLEADCDLLDVMVVTRDSVKNAAVGLSRIDVEDPQITVSSEDGKIVLTATDDKSGLEGLWYGVKEPTVALPAYVPYEEPFLPEEGKVYGYFAMDRAGNVTQPVITDLTPATSISLAQEQMALFPGERGNLTVVPEPANAFVNQLQMVSADPSVATVDERGVVSALADGETDITVTASELGAVTCHVTVRSFAEFTISAVGDVTLGEDVNFSPLNSFSTVQTMYGDSYFFDNVRDIFASDDVTFANFEGTLTTASTRMEKQFAFRGDPSYTNILVDGSIEAVTLANNHSADYGEQSLADTQNYLTQAGIDWCLGDQYILKDYHGVKTALIGIYVLAEGEEKAEQVERVITQAKEAGAQLIVVAFHWGTELETKPDETQKKLARLAIDTGADLVVGHHPHVLQGIEKYSGKYICYSLGNFCFGGNSNPSDQDTIIFRQTFQVLRGGEIEGGAVQVIPCSISSVSGWNNYQPTPAEGEEQERILQKLNELCEPFGTSF